MAEMLIRGIPDKLRLSFKILCATEDISMNKKVIQLIENAVRAGPQKNSSQK